MFGFGGWLNRLGWDETGDGWDDEGVGELMDDHIEYDGCPGGEADWFDEYPDQYWCHYCGAEL